MKSKCFKAVHKICAKIYVEVSLCTNKHSAQISRTNKHTNKQINKDCTNKHSVQIPRTFSSMERLVEWRMHRSHFDFDSFSRLSYKIWLKFVIQLLIWISSEAAVCWHDKVCRVVGIGLDDVYTAPSPTCGVRNIDSLLTHFTLLSNPPMPMPSMSKSSKSTWTPSSASAYLIATQKASSPSYVSLRGDASPGAIENKLEFVSLERSNEHSTLLVNI